MSSRLVAMKAVKPVEIAVISPFMSVDALNSVVPKVRTLQQRCSSLAESVRDALKGVLLTTSSLIYVGLTHSLYV